MKNKFVVSNVSIGLIVIVLLGLTIRLIFFSGYVGGDDAAHLAQAAAYAQDDYSPPETHWGARSGITVATAFVIKALGVSRVSITLLPMLLSIGSIFLSFALARELFDERIGLLAALLVAIAPIEVIYASHLFPMAFISFFSCLSLYLFIRADRSGSASLYALTGLALGLAYLTRITAVFAILFFVAYVITFRRFQKGYFVIGFSFLAVVLAESFAFYRMTGDPLHRLHILSSRNPIAGSSDAASASSDIGLAWLLEPLIRPLTEQELGFFFLMLLIAVFWALFTPKSRGTAVLLLWIIPIFVYTCYGTVSLENYVTLRRLPRYLAPVIVPGMVLVAWLIVSTRFRRLAMLSMAGLAAFALLALNIDSSRQQTVREAQIAGWISDQPNAITYLPRPLFFDVHFYLGLKPNANLRLIENSNDRSHGLKRISQVYPSVSRINSSAIDNLECDSYVFTRVGYFEAEQLPPDTIKIASFTAPPSFLVQLLEIDMLRRIASLVRDPKRFTDLNKVSSRRTTDVYHRVCTAEI